MTELHFVFLKYNADGGATLQEKEGRWEEGGCYVTPSLAALSPCALLVNQETVGLTG